MNNVPIHKIKEKCVQNAPQIPQNLFGERERTCLGCGLPIYDDKKYHNGICRSKAYRKRAKQREQERREKTFQEYYSAAEKYDRKHPEFFQELKSVAKTLMNRRPCATIRFRLIAQIALFNINLLINNNILNCYYRPKLEKALPGLRLGEKRERK